MNIFLKYWFSFMAVLMLTLPSLSQIWTHDFETNGLGITYTSPTVFTANLNAHYNRTSGNNISNTISPYSGAHGTFYWAGENINIGVGGGDGLSDKTITFSPITVTGISSLEFRGLFASGNFGNGWDYSDQFYVEYKMDAGPWTKVLQFASNAAIQNAGLYHDVNLDGIGEGLPLTSAFQQFTATIPVTGTSIQFRIFTKCTSQGEEFAFDYLRLYNTSSTIAGCTNPIATNYSPTATTDNGTCIISGCTDISALNYNPIANTSNGSCVYTVPQVVINEILYNPNDLVGFTDVLFEFVELHNPTSTSINIAGWRLSDAVDLTFTAGTIIPANGYLVAASTNATYTGNGYGVQQFSDDLSNIGETIRLYNNSNILVDQVTYASLGCWPISASENGASLELINPNLDNNDPNSYCANFSINGTPGATNSCFNGEIAGCTSSEALNFNPQATADDGSCLIEGCICSDAVNYNANANVDDGSCTYDEIIFGCTYASASNFNSLATIDDGSCIFMSNQSCPADLNGDLIIGVTDLIQFLALYGTTCNP